MTNIVMTVRDRWKLTAQALESLAANTDRSEYNLTLVDDGSEDFRVKKLLAHAAEDGAQLLTLTNSSHVLGAVKNLGVRASESKFGQGEWLYLSDNDVWFAPYWLQTLTQSAELTEPDRFKLWGGQIHPFHHPAQEPLVLGNGKCVQAYDILDGPSWLMRGDTWKELGGLNEGGAAGVCKGEDVEFCRRIVADCHAYGRIGVVKPHVVEHTGITNSDGVDAPGADERRKAARLGVLYE